MGLGSFFSISNLTSLQELRNLRILLTAQQLDYLQQYLEELRKDGKLSKNMDQR
jgi:hypothetical protein